MDFTALKEAAWIGVPSFTLPQFSWRAIALIAPCAIVPCLEHIGDVMAVGTVVGKDFTHEPGLDRSVFACGVSTVLSGCLGGPSLTIHSENTGVLAVTHLYSPTIVRFGALWMALLAFCPKFNALCGSIPQAVLGGVGILLYGMVTSTGIRTLVDHHVDFLSPATCASRLLSSSWVSAALPSASAPSPSAAWLSPPSPASSCTSCCPAVRRSKQFSTHPLLYTVSGSARYPGTAAESTFLQPARFLPRCPSSSLCRGKNARRATALRAV